MKKAFLCLCLVFLLPLAAQARDLPSIDASGLQALLDRNRGKAVMLNFFATWCPPCKAEMPELVKLREAFPETDFLLIGLSVDEDKSAVAPFVERANYPIYMADKSVTDKFSVSSVPHNAFFSKNGELTISEPGMANVSVLKDVVNSLLAR